MSRGPLSPQWRWVTILGALTVVGLAAALFGDGGPMWWLSWLTIAAPLAVAARYVWGRGDREPHTLVSPATATRATSDPLSARPQTPERPWPSP